MLFTINLLYEIRQSLVINLMFHFFYLFIIVIIIFFFEWSLTALFEFLSYLDDLLVWGSINLFSNGWNLVGMKSWKPNEINLDDAFVC